LGLGSRTGRPGPPGSKRAVTAAARGLLQEGNAWARRVKRADRAHRRAMEHPGGAAEESRDEVAATAADLRDAREDVGALRAALARLERELDACQEPEAGWARRARVEAERTAAGLAGRPDPIGDAQGMRSGWRGIPPAVRLGIGLWLVIAGALVIGVLADAF
jgi:hypothetical protein